MEAFNIQLPESHLTFEPQDDGTYQGLEKGQPLHSFSIICVVPLAWIKKELILLNRCL